MRKTITRHKIITALSMATLLAAIVPAAVASSYAEQNLVTDDQSALVAAGFTSATHIDPNLVNAWGLSHSATSPFWVSDNGTGLTTLYNGVGNPASLVVTIPPPAGGSPPSAPTGQVFNTTSGFQIVSGSHTGKSIFLFSTEDGTISGWNPAVGGVNATLAVDNSGSAAVYKGIAIGSNSANQNFLYAANFRSGNIDAFNSTFGAAGSFTDPTVPAGYAPFNIQNLDGRMYVTYALQNAAKHDDVAGLGNGFVDVFDPNSSTFTRLISGGQLDSPWGLALAPSDFGSFSNDLLVGNFGNGWINAYNPLTGSFIGTLHDPNGNPISIDGLWGLSFGNNAGAGPADTLYFSAGFDGEQHGLFGRLTTVPEPPAAATLAIGMIGLLSVALLRRRRIS